MLVINGIEYVGTAVAAGALNITRQRLNIILTHHAHRPKDIIDLGGPTRYLIPKPWIIEQKNTKGAKK